MHVVHRAADLDACVVVGSRRSPTDKGHRKQPNVPDAERERGFLLTQVSNKLSERTSSGHGPCVSHAYGEGKRVATGPEGVAATSIAGGAGIGLLLSFFANRIRRSLLFRPSSLVALPAA